MARRILADRVDNHGRDLETMTCAANARPVNSCRIDLVRHIDPVRRIGLGHRTDLVHRIDLVRRTGPCS
jgi:hypothetical protein